MTYKPSWTRRDRIGRLNRMVLSRVPAWTADDVERHRAEAERMTHWLVDTAD